MNSYGNRRQMEARRYSYNHISEPAVAKNVRVIYDTRCYHFCYYYHYNNIIYINLLDDNKIYFIQTNQPRNEWGGCCSTIVDDGTYNI